MSYDALLTDACSIVRRTAGAFDPGTGTYAAATSTAIYTGVCHVEPLSGVGGTRRAIGEEAVVLRGHRVFLPTETSDVKTEDVVMVTESDDAALVGKELVVKDSSALFSPVTDRAARWLICEDVVEGT